MSFGFHSADFSVSVSYSSPDSPPPTPFVVSTVPEYLGGRLTPPPSPLRLYATPAVDDHAPCPATPHCVRGGIEWSNAPNSGTSQSTPSWNCSVSQPNHLVGPLSSNNANDDDPFDLRPHPSDDLINDPDEFAYPCVTLIMIQRAKLDRDGLQKVPINPLADGLARKLFALSGGYPPMSSTHDDRGQSFDYYKRLSLGHPPREQPPYRFSISAIEALQHDLPVRWRLVYPEPIPPVIIRLHDLIGRYHLPERKDGFAFVLPTEDSIWATVCQRGIDSAYRPINPSLKIDTGLCFRGEAVYFPQHTVASRFAVNLFLESPDSEGRDKGPQCDYLGAYVLQVMDGLTMCRLAWADVDPNVQRSVFDRVPHYFEGSRHPSHGWPRLPYVQFFYYKWDPSIIGAAKKLLERPSDSESDQDSASTSSGYSSDSEYTSYSDDIM